MDVTTTVNPYGATVKRTDNDTVSNPDAILGKDDFMKLLLTELRYQDPTNPMDSEKMLTQTSQLATLEASDNTNKTLEKLAGILTQSSSLSIVSAIGKTASLKEKGFMLDEEGSTTFDIYLPEDISSGRVEITDNQGNIVRSFPVDSASAGTLSFSWDGTDDSGTRRGAGLYRATLVFTDDKGVERKAETGEYPIEGVRFDNGEALLKIGNRYLSMNEIEEILGEAR